MEHAWRNGMLATALISSVPTLVLPLIPADATKVGSWANRVLLCFAVGGMLGDVFLHLLPHLLEHSHHHEHTHHHEHSHHEHTHAQGHHDERTSESLISAHANEHHGHGHGHGHRHGFEDLLLPVTVLAGFLLFFMSERVVRGLLGESGGHSHHSHSHQKSGSATAVADDVARRKKNDDHHVTTETCTAKNDRHDNDDGVKLKAAGILNLAADALHNFTDGIAIGASFATGTGLGYSTALATLMHELPHEIGDFAVLVQSGMSKWQAIRAQFATATAAFAGTAIGLVATSYAGLEKLLLAATGGGFVYVSCVAVMPDIVNGSPSFLQATAEVSAMCLGIALMAGVALLE